MPERPRRSSVPAPVIVSVPLVSVYGACPVAGEDDEPGLSSNVKFVAHAVVTAATPQSSQMLPVLVSLAPASHRS